MVIFEPEIEPDYSDVEPFARCRSCLHSIKLEIIKERVVLDERNCPACGVFLRKDEIKKSLEICAEISRGVRFAKELVSNDWIIIPVLAMVLIEMFIGYYIKNKLSFIAYFIFPIAFFLLFWGYFRAQKWLDKYGYLVNDDEEFLFAKNEIRRSRMIWVAAIILNLFSLLIYIKLL